MSRMVKKLIRIVTILLLSLASACGHKVKMSQPIAIFGLGYVCSTTNDLEYDCVAEDSAARDRMIHDVCKGVCSNSAIGTAYRLEKLK